MTKNIAQIVVGLPVDGPFDYKVADQDQLNISVGHRVSVPFAGRQLTGYVVGFSRESDFENLKTLIKILDEEPIFDEQQLALMKAISAHYGCSLGEAVETALPFSVRKRKALPLRCRQEQESSSGKGGSFFQSINLVLGFMSDAHIQEQLFKEIAEVRAQGRGVLCLAPDADSAKKFYQILEQKFKDQVLYFDGKSGKKQIEQWLSVWTGEARIVVSARSGVFLPLRNLGLIILSDEDHYGYLEDQTPFYHAREVARMRASEEGCSLMFTAQVPSVELWRYAQQEQWTVVRHSDSFPAARFVCVDLRNYKPQRSLHFSVPIFQALTDAVTAGKKVLVLLNRRGFGTFTHCPHCEFVVRCPRCEVAFCYNEEAKTFVCPRCHKSEAISLTCPSCKKSGLKFAGGGVDRVASDLARLVPQARICVIDRKRKTVPKAMDLCIGTQAVFQIDQSWRPDVAAVLDIDSELGRTDFRSSQKVFSELAALRRWATEAVFVQTWDPDQEVFLKIRNFDLDSFYAGEMEKRRGLMLPPFAHLISVVCRSPKQERAMAQSQDIYEHLLKADQEELEIHEPQEDFQSKLRDQYRFIIIFKSPHAERDVAIVRKVLRSVRRKAGVVTTVQVDP